MKTISRHAPLFLLFAVALCLLATAPTFAQDHASGVIPNTVWVGADGKYEAEPDTAVMQFNISAQDDNLPAANSRASKAAEQVRQLLRTNGLDPKQAQVGSLSVQPVYDYKNPKRKLVAYRVETSITIKLTDFSKIAPLTQGISDMDVSGNQSLSYILEDMDAAKIKAVEDALRRAHNEAEAVAKAGGRTLGELSYASVDTFEQPRPRPMMMASKAVAMNADAMPAPTEDFGAQKITVTAHVNTLYSLK